MDKLEQTKNNISDSMDNIASSLDKIADALYSQVKTPTISTDNAMIQASMTSEVYLQ